MTTLPGRAARTIPARIRPIIRATELGKASVLKAGSLVLLSDSYGDVAPDRRGLGLYLGDTRILSTSVLQVEGRKPTLVRPDPGGSSRGLVQMSNPELPDDPTRSVDHPVALPRQSLGIRRSRELGVDGALRERVVISNYTMAPQAVVVRLLLDVDGADIFEVRGRTRARRGQQLAALADADDIRFRYRGLDGRELVTAIALAPAPDEIRRARAREHGSVAVTWSVHLAPGSSTDLGWAVRAGWTPAAEGVVAGIATTPADDADLLHDAAPDAPGPDEPDAVIETDDELVNLVLERALADLELLQTPGPGPSERFVAAGIPWFATLFGRDSLVAGYAALPYRPRIARDAVEVLARLQATDDDPDRDAEPGKILHELRAGEMARTGELPFARYYGSVDATPLWLITLAELLAWAATGASWTGSGLPWTGP